MTNENDIAKILAKAQATSVDAALEEEPRAYEIWLTSSDGLGLKFLEFGRLTAIIAKLNNTLPKAEVTQYNYTIIDSKTNRCVWNIESLANVYDQSLTLVGYKRKPHWWNREPRINWTIVKQVDLNKTTSAIRAMGYKTVAHLSLDLVLTASRERGSELFSRAIHLLTEALDGYTTKE